MALRVNPLARVLANGCIRESLLGFVWDDTIVIVVSWLDRDAHGWLHLLCDQIADAYGEYEWHYAELEYEAYLDEAIAAEIRQLREAEEAELYGSDSD